jgi:DNA-directed RNA polymerase specialized sigma24 family protein
VILELLAKRHDEWIRMAMSFGLDRDTAKDLVQDMYLRMYKYVDNPERIMYNENEVNTYFVFVVLRNLHLTNQKGIKYEPIGGADIDGSYELPNYDMEEAHNNLIDELWEEVEGWHWYDTKLFKLYHNTDMTIKKISEETKISERSIWNTLDNGRKRIQTNRKEAYEAWKTTKKG